MIGFQFYAAGTFQFLIILVQGAILFAKGANRSEHFARRLTLNLLGLFLISLPLTLGYWRIDQAAGSAVLSNSAIVVLYLTLYLLTAAMLKRCFQLSCRSCLMAAATGYVCQHIFYEIRLIVNVFLKLDVALYAAVGWPAGFWVSFFLELAMAEGVLFLLRRLFGQRAAAFSLDDASSSDVTLMIVATLGLVLIVNAFLNIYASESQALAMMVRALLTIACLFILLLRAGFLKSGHLQSELEVLSRLHEQERRHYEHLKENMEAISIKCHDIKHFISSRMARAGIDNEELSELVRIYDTRIKTGNDTIDVLLSEQSLVCQRRNIRVTVLADASGLSFIGTTDAGRKSSGVRAQSPQDDADDGGAGRRAAHFPAHGAETSAKIRLSSVQRRQQDSHQPGRASALAGWSAADCCHLNFSQNVLAPCCDVCYDHRSTLTIESAYTARGD